jgi:hypothetical protein
MGYWLDGRGSIPGRDRDFFLYCVASRPALRSTQPPIQLVSEALSQKVKGPGRCNNDVSDNGRTDVSYVVNAERLITLIFNG